MEQDGEHLLAAARENEYLRRFISPEELPPAVLQKASLFCAFLYPLPLIYPSHRGLLLPQSDDNAVI